MTANVSTVLANPGDLAPEFGINGIFPVPSGPGSIRSIVADGQGRFVLAVWADDKIWLLRIFADGTQDFTFGQNNGVTTWSFAPGIVSQPVQLIMCPDGRFYLLGQLGSDIFKRETALMMFNKNGTPNLIHGNKIIPEANILAPRACVQADGKLLVVLRWASPGSDEHRTVLHRRLQNGDTDMAFGVEGFLNVRLNGEYTQGSDVKVTADDKILLGATIRRGSPAQLFKAVARFNNDGSVDRTFGIDGVWLSEVSNSLDNMTVDQNSIVCIGTHYSIDTGYQASISKVTLDGDYDPIFNNGSTVKVGIPSDYLGYFVASQSVFVLADGSVMVGGYVGPNDTAFWLLLLPDGTLAAGFGENGIAVYREETLLYDLVQVDDQLMIAAIDTLNPRKPNVFGIRIK